MAKAGRPRKVGADDRTSIYMRKEDAKKLREMAGDRVQPIWYVFGEIVERAYREHCEARDNEQG